MNIEVYRGEILESIHNIYYCYIKDNQIIDSYQKDFVTTYRSSAKPLQAIPMLSLDLDKKYNLTEKEIAVICSSHNAQDEHLNTVRSILKKANLDEKHLQCGIRPPMRKEVYESILRSNNEILPIHNDCSGKHSGALLTIKHLNEDIDTYLELKHSHQQRIRKFIADICNTKKEKIGMAIDDCGIPVFSTSLENMANSYKVLANAFRYKNLISKNEIDACNRIFSAMTQNPWYVGGDDRFCTRFIEHGNKKWIGKIGAEAVYCIGIKDENIGIAIKALDGSFRAIYAAVLFLLEKWKIINKEIFNKFRDFIYLKNSKNDEVVKLKANYNVN